MQRNPNTRSGFQARNYFQTSACLPRRPAYSTCPLRMHPSATPMHLHRRASPSPGHVLSGSLVREFLLVVGRSCFTESVAKRRGRGAVGSRTDEPPY